jgi:hypothetical protein
VYLEGDNDKEALRAVMTLLDLQYPEVLDRTLEARLTTAKAAAKSEGGKKGTNSTGDKSKRFHALTQLLSSTCSGTRHQMVGGDNQGTTLFLALSHPSAGVRLSSIETLEKLIATGGVDKEYAGRALIMRLDDDSVNVIERVLAVTNIRSMISSTVLIDRLLSLMATHAAKLPMTHHAAQLVAHDPLAHRSNRDSVRLLCTLMEFIATDVFPTGAAASLVSSSVTSSYLSYLLEFLLARPLTVKLSRSCLILAAKLAPRAPLFAQFEPIFAAHGDIMKSIATKSDQDVSETKDKDSKKESKEVKEVKTSTTKDEKAQAQLIAVNEAIIQQLVSDVVTLTGHMHHHNNVTAREDSAISQTSQMVDQITCKE